MDKITINILFGGINDENKNTNPNAEAAAIGLYNFKTFLGGMNDETKKIFQKNAFPCFDVLAGCRLCAFGFFEHEG